MKKLVKSLCFAAALMFCSYVHAQAAGTNNVTLAWDAVSWSVGITNYSVYYGVATGAYTNTVLAGTNLTAVVPNLVSGTKYFFAATCTDVYGMESPFSVEISYTPPYPRPLPPGNLRKIAP